MSTELFDFFGAPEDVARGRLNESAKTGLSDGYCARCDRMVMPTGIIYEADHPEASPDGVVSEWECPRCGRREGRWTGSVLTGGASEPLNGVEDDSKIEACQERFPSGSQPR